jgi:hypothetical protein
MQKLSIRHIPQLKKCSYNQLPSYWNLFFDESIKLNTLYISPAKTYHELFCSALRFDVGAIVDIYMFQDISDMEENARMPLAIR